MATIVETTDIYNASNNGVGLIDSSGDDLTIVAGVNVYGGTAGGAYDGAYSAGAGISADILGTLWGNQYGIDFTGSNADNNIMVGATGVVIGNTSAAIQLAAGYNTITNAGQIISAATEAVVVDSTGYGTTITNSGLIQGGSGNIGIFDTGTGPLYMTNSGTIYGVVSPSGGYCTIFNQAAGNITNVIELAGGNATVTNVGDVSDIYFGGGGNLVVNSGVVDGGGIYGGYTYYGIALNTPSGAIDKISNSGTIESPANVFAIWDSGDGELDVANSGTITGGIDSASTAGGADILIETGGHVSAIGHAAIVLSGSGNTITNNGEISVADGNYTIDLSGSIGDTVTNSGTISGVVTLGNYDTVTNSDGTISNGIVFAYGNILTNSGTIDGGIQGAGAAIIENAGTITRGIADFNAAADTIDNTGKILGMIDEQAAILTNSGTMHGELDFVAQSSLDNSGTITGEVIFNGADDSVTNSGTIHGAVSLGTGDSFVNSGTIHGTLTLGTSDTLDLSSGAVTGLVTANTSDTFDFSGQFGHYRIADFAAYATHHTGYDVLAFASDEFTSYTELQSHMAQVGADVVITLDATDDIVLLGTKLTTLNAHDFAFT